MLSRRMVVRMKEMTMKERQERRRRDKRMVRLKKIPKMQLR